METSLIHCKYEENGKKCGELLFKSENITIGAKLEIKCPKCKRNITIVFTNDGWEQYLKLE